jgi:hypothetical protein
MGGRLHERRWCCCWLLAVALVALTPAAAVSCRVASRRVASCRVVRPSCSYVAFAAITSIGVIALYISYLGACV